MKDNVTLIVSGIIKQSHHLLTKFNGLINFGFILILYIKLVILICRHYHRKYKHVHFLTKNINIGQVASERDHICTFVNHYIFAQWPRKKF